MQIHSRESDNIRIEPKSKKQEKKEQTIQQKTTQHNLLAQKLLKYCNSTGAKSFCSCAKKQSSTVAAKKNNVEAATSVMNSKKETPAQR